MPVGEHVGDTVAWEGGESGAPLGVPLVDLLDRVLAAGVVVSGDLVIAVAEVPLVRLSLNALLSSVNERVPAPWADGGPL
ncbi:gas vesicle protein [Streptomyces sp. NPDC050560]|uniref:gas vesicle protein n=1 Tax=Streptomyces sp. NPDC050560 TaxID=3365630 RepID=UPI0037B329C3